MIETVNNTEIYFAKIRETAKIPTKKDEDAGYDLYANFEEENFVIGPGESRAVPTGIAVAFSKDYYAQIEERSSMAKIGVKKSGGVFDSGYRGEYMIVTYNTNKKPFIITKNNIDEIGETLVVGDVAYKKEDVILYPYTKAICQMVMQIIPKLESKEISYEELKGIASERGVGGFGSSKK